ncbi:MAG: hypothetical protein ACHREM_20595 [Polyangiales bacterium]
METVILRSFSGQLVNVASRSALVIVVAALGLYAAPSSRAAEPTPAELTEAHTRFDKGLTLFREGAFEAAAAEFERAYQLAPSFKILYDLGLAYARGHDPAAALRTFVRYLRDGGEAVPADRRASVERELADLQGRVARVRVEIAVTGAAISVDDVDAGTSPLIEPLVVNPGRHKVTARVGDGAPVVELVTVVGGESRTVTLALVERPSPSRPEPSVSVSAAPSIAPSSIATIAPSASAPTAPSSTSAPPPTVEHSGADRRTIGWISSAIALGAGAAFGGLALYESHELTIARGADGQSRDGLDQLQSRTRLFAAGADVFFVTAIAIGGLSLYWTLDKPRGEPHPTPVVGLVVAPSQIALRLDF